MNVVCIHGRLVRDPDMNYSTSGTSRTKFTVATPDRRKNKQTQEWEDDPAFVDCTCWAGVAEKVGQFLKKGDLVAVQGRLQTEKWTTKDGANKSKLSVNAQLVRWDKKGADINQLTTTTANQQAQPPTGDEVPF